MLAYLFILGFVLTSSYAQTCTFDYQCPNIPYGYCSGGESDCTTVLNSFGVNNQSIYYIQLCRTNGLYGNYTFKRIPIDGGVPVDVYSRQEIQRSDNPSRVLGLIDQYLFFDIIYRAPGKGVNSIDVTKGFGQTEGSVNTDALTQSVVEFDTNSNTPATYLCNYVQGVVSNYTIEKYPVFPPSGEVKSRGVLYTLPSSDTCASIKRYSDVDLFFTTNVNSPNGTTSYFYQGTTTCSNCPLPKPFFSVHEQVIDFDVSGDYVFYGTPTGLFRVNRDGGNNVELMNEGTVGVIVANDRVIYNNAMKIKSISLSGGSPKLLSLPRTSGSCVCRPGFSGDDCSSCSGQIQWQPVSMRPTCASLDATGRPTSCYYDWQCGNAPFTACYSNTCTCFNANFTGSRCDVCAPPKQVTWNSFGYPKCA